MKGESFPYICLNRKKNHSTFRTWCRPRFQSSCGHRDIGTCPWASGGSTNPAPCAVAAVLAWHHPSTHHICPSAAKYTCQHKEDMAVFRDGCLERNKPNFCINILLCWVIPAHHLKLQPHSRKDSLLGASSSPRQSFPITHWRTSTLKLSVWMFGHRPSYVMVKNFYEVLSSPQRLGFMLPGNFPQILSHFCGSCGGFLIRQKTA